MTFFIYDHDDWCYLKQKYGSNEKADRTKWFCLNFPQSYNANIISFFFVCNSVFFS